MSILAWVLLGLLAGFIASRIVVSRSSGGLFVDLMLGIGGAFLGGWLFHLVGQTGITGFNLWSVFVATIGAVFVLSIYHMLTARRMPAT